MRPALLFLTVLLAGCGPGRGDLTGRVTCDGKPVVRGSVSVLAAGQPPRTVAIRAGTYAVPDVPAGPVKFAVHSPNPKEVAVISRNPADARKAAAEKAKEAVGWFPIPERYGHFDRSDLTFDVKAGANQCDLTLKGS